MFDDQQPKNAGVPSNLPTAEPEDIFAGTKVDDTAPLSDAPAGDVPSVPEESTSSALGAGVLKPKSQSLSPPPQREHVSMPPPPDTMVPGNVEPESPMKTIHPNIPPSSPVANTPMGMGYDAPGGNIIREPVGSRKTVFSIVIVVVVLLLVVSGIWVYFSVIRTNDGNPDDFVDTIDTDVVTPIEDDADEPIVPDEIDTDVDEELDDDMPPSADEDDSDILFGEDRVDTDSDRLDDVDEAKLGTDPLNWDTDGDGLGDGDEVSVWKTDPLNPDTDGDTYLDGVEVKNGYNPSGDGKIFQPPTST